MPITQDRMVTIIEEALALRDYIDAYRKMTKGFIDVLKHSPADTHHDLLREFNMELNQLEYPEIITILLEQIHFKKAYRYNEREKMRLRGKSALDRPTAKYEGPIKTRTRLSSREIAEKALADAAKKFEYEPASATLEDVQQMFDPSKQFDPEAELPPKFDQALHDKLNQALAEPDKKKDG